MKWIRLAVGSVVAIGLTFAPGIIPSASGAGVLVTTDGRNIVAASGETLRLAALFTPVPKAPPPEYLRVVVTLTGGLAFSDGQQVLVSQGSGAMASSLNVPVTAKSSGAATMMVTALVGSTAITDEASKLVDVPAPTSTIAPVPPAPGTVRLLTSTGPVAATPGQTLQLGTLFKSVEVGKDFNVLRFEISVTMTGGLVFVANGAQSTGLGGPNAMFDALLITVRANSSGTVTLKVRAKTAHFDILDEATGSVNVPMPATAPAPSSTAGPLPASTVAPTPGSTSVPGVTGAAAPSGNRPPTAIGRSVIVKAGTATAVVLKGTDPEGKALTYSVVDFPEHGRLTGRAPNLRYVPEKGFVGADAFTFAVSDGVSTSEEAVVSVTVISAKRIVVRTATTKKKK